MTRKVFLIFSFASMTLFAQTLPQGMPHDAFSELVFRYLQGPGVARQFSPEFFLGRLPDGLPVSIPLPPRARLLGSVRREKTLSIVADVNEPTVQIRDFYRSALTAAGWQEISADDAQRPRGIIMPSTSQATTYCMGPRGPGLSVSATETGGQAADLRLTLTLDPRNSPCSRRSGTPGRFDWTPLPRLSTPEGVRWIGGSGSGGSQEYQYTQALVEADIAITDLASRFAPQLEKEGWTKSSENTGRDMIVSSWSRRDESGSTWQTVLTLTRLGSGNRVAVHLSTYLVE